MTKSRFTEFLVYQANLKNVLIKCLKIQRSRGTIGSAGYDSIRSKTNNRQCLDAKTRPLQGPIRRVQSETVRRVFHHHQRSHRQYESTAVSSL